VFGGWGEGVGRRWECGGEGLRVEGSTCRVAAVIYHSYIIHYFILDFTSDPSDNFVDSTAHEILKLLFWT
jgi:hypothetical protein